MYKVEIWHHGLNKYRVIKGKDQYIVFQKAEAQKLRWQEMWEKKQEQQAIYSEREKVAREKGELKLYADQLTKEAFGKLEIIENILKSALINPIRIDWKSMKSTKDFTIPKPTIPETLRIPVKPNKHSEIYHSKQNVLNRWIKNEPAKHSDLYQQHYEHWEKSKRNIEKINGENKKKYVEELKEWEKKKQMFLQEQQAINVAIEQQIINYVQKNPSAIIEYYDILLATSNYPDWCPQEFDLDYYEQTETLIVNYLFPSFESMPTLLEVKFDPFENVFKEIHLPTNAQNKMYEHLLYQITLRTIYEIVHADQVDAIKEIVLNGWIKTEDEKSMCVLTIKTTKEIFNEIHLAYFDSKTCFNQLNGIAGKRLHGLERVTPLMQTRQVDERFDESFNHNFV